MEAALDGLAGVVDVEVDLGRDAFSVTFDTSQISLSEIQEAITQLGFEPRLEAGRELEPAASTASTTAVPEPVASALTRARGANKLVLIDFYAEWCAPCKVLHAKTLPDSRVQKALEGFVVVKADMDVDLAAAEYFGVVAMPTLVVLTSEGEELSRYVGGSISPSDLAELLLEARRSSAN